MISELANSDRAGVKLRSFRKASLFANASGMHFGGALLG